MSARNSLQSTMASPEGIGASQFPSVECVRTELAKRNDTSGEPAKLLVANRGVRFET